MVAILKSNSSIQPPFIIRFNHSEIIPIRYLQLAGLCQIIQKAHRLFWMIFSAISSVQWTNKVRNVTRSPLQSAKFSHTRTQDKTLQDNWRPGGNEPLCRHNTLVNLCLFCDNYRRSSFCISCALSCLWKVKNVIDWFKQNWYIITNNIQCIKTFRFLNLLKISLERASIVRPWVQN